MLNSKFSKKFINFGPLIRLYYLSISEVDTHFENYFEILSFNIQLIIIYFWVLKSPLLLGNGHIFFCRFNKWCSFRLSFRTKFISLFSNFINCYLYKKYDSSHYYSLGLVYIFYWPIILKFNILFLSSEF